MGWNCFSCRFYYFSRKECRRYAPRMISGSGTGWSDQLWPEALPEDYCGEFERKPEEKTDE